MQAGTKAAGAQDAATGSRDLDCDVLVVGMGFSGPVAALRALECGARVIAIDKQARGWWTPGGAMMIHSELHIAFRSMSEPESVLIREMNAVTDGMIPRDLLEATARHAGRAMQWIMGHGAEFEEPAGSEFRFKPQPPSRVWARIKPGGIYDLVNYGLKKLVLKLEAKIQQLGGRILYATKAVKVLTDDRGGVTGLTVQDGEGRFNIRAKSVILCTGGYEQNNEMLVKYLGPRADEIIRFVGPWGTGDAYRLCAELGAQIRSMNYAALSHYYSIDARQKEDLLGAYLEAPGIQGILVNRSGQRFVDEGLGPRYVGSLMTKTSIEISGWIIIDHAIYSIPEVKARVEDVRTYGGTIHTADTLAELAQMAGISPRLAQTVAEYDQAVADDKTAELAVPRSVPKQTHALSGPARTGIRRISQPPYLAIPFLPGLVATYGGFLVNPQGQVLDWDKQVIPGLYAAGLAMNGSTTGGAENPAGAYVGFQATALIFGLLAAEHAAGA